MEVTDQLSRVDRYQLIPRTLIFLVWTDYVLLIKGSSNKRLWPNLYNGLGGHVEQGEDILGSARRELYEESGLLTDHLRLVGVITVNTGESPGIVIFVLRGDLPDQATVRPDRRIQTAEGTLVWVSRSDLAAIPLVDDLNILLPKVLGIKPADAPFSARYTHDNQGHMQFLYDAL